MELLTIFISIIVLFIIALFLWNSYQRRKGNTERDEDIQADPVDGTCCGQHNICVKDSLMNSFLEVDFDYFDDEELDQYKGRHSEDYLDNEVDEFRDVLYTMKDSDKPRWIRSLLQREIEIPNQLKDEIIIFVNDLRTATELSPK